MSTRPLAEEAALSDRWDVVVVGGSLAGAATAWLLRRDHPALRILVIEKSTAFKRRVGESTVEISSFFLNRVLDLSEHLLRDQLIKQGLRFWFSNEHSTGWDDCSEIGPAYNTRLPSFQVDRAKLDSHLLQRCIDAGVTVWRPAKVRSVALEAGGEQTLEVEKDEARLAIRTRWVIDASGPGCLLARQEGWLEPNTAHPTASAWCRWQGVANWDAPALRASAPDYNRRCHGQRQTATNHLIGDGWWSWWIPLHDGETSVGVVWDERLMDLAEGSSLPERIRAHVSRHPLGAKLLARAEPVERDSHFRRPLAYHSRRTMGDGFALVGDANAFLDPFYSPGMDWISFTVMQAVDVIGRERRGEPYAAELERYGRQQPLSYRRWFDGIYRDKYVYMGDWELMRTAFLLDTCGYYIGVVSQPYKHGEAGLLNAPLAGPHTAVPAWILRSYNRRLVRMAWARRRRGTFGRANHGHFQAFENYTFDSRLYRRALSNFGRLAGLETREGWRSWRAAPDTENRPA